MLFNQSDITTSKNNTITNYEKGYVLIEKKRVVLKHDSYTKREKIYDNNNIWIDTKPLIIDKNSIF